ncbi:MAG: ATP-binding protein [Lachnospiraceae bacterium]|nr:ATP-binding protein [Lachnospiraceae bacterium]
MTRKIFIYAFLTGGLVLILCGSLFFGLQYKQTLDENYEALKREADFAAAGLMTGGTDYLKSLRNNGNITWIAADGSVIYDSRQASDNNNQREYKEVRDAFEKGEGQGIRDSIDDNNTMYYACLCDDGTVLRLSRPVSVVKYAFSSVSPVLWVFVLVSIISGVVAFRVAKLVLRPINDLNLDNPDTSDIYSELEPLVNRLQEQKATINEQMDELKHRQREFAALTNSMEEGFLLIDKEGFILSANTAAIRLTNGCEIGDVLKFSDEDINKELQKALDGAHSEALMAHDGRSYRVIVNPVLVHKRVSGVVLLMLDVTEKEQRERLRQEFSANVSHELKTPLTSISGFAELIHEGLCTEEKMREFSGDIYRESQRLITLVDDIIKLSRLDEEGVIQEFEEVDLYRVAEDVMDSLKSAAEKRSITFELTGTHAYINGVWQTVHEMIYNLCDNAIKYNREGGSVRIAVEENTDVVKIFVEDTGIGIPYSEQERIFERFYRVDKSHSKRIGGTGLGLSIVKHGAQLHNARTEVESVPGKGTRVTLLFPKSSEGLL